MFFAHVKSEFYDVRVNERLNKSNTADDVMTIICGFRKNEQKYYPIVAMFAGKNERE